MYSTIVASTITITENSKLKYIKEWITPSLLHSVYYKMNYL